MDLLSYLALLDGGKELLVLFLADLKGFLKVDEDIFDGTGRPFTTADGVHQTVNQFRINILHLESIHNKSLAPR